MNPGYLKTRLALEALALKHSKPLLISPVAGAEREEVTFRCGRALARSWLFTGLKTQTSHILQWQIAEGEEGIGFSAGMRELMGHCSGKGPLKFSAMVGGRQGLMDKLGWGFQWVDNGDAFSPLDEAVAAGSSMSASSPSRRGGVTSARQRAAPLVADALRQMISAAALGCITDATLELAGEALAVWDGIGADNS